MAASTSNGPSAAVVGDATVRPFRIEVPQEELDELLRRIAATRWPSRELVADDSQGVQLATLQALARYWASDYDLRRIEARLNALPQFTTEIDGLDVHFLHVKSPHEHALPLVITHGWPGSVIELLEVPPHRPDRPRRPRRGRLPPRAAVAARVRLLRRTDRGRLGRRPRRARLGGADAAARLRPLRRPGRRRGRRRHPRDGRTGAQRAGRPPLQPAAVAPARRGRGDLRRRAGAGGDVRAGTGGLQCGRDGVPARLPGGAVHAAPDDRLRGDGFTRRAGGLDARPRPGQLREDLPRLPRRAARGPSHPGPDRRQHHAVLADRHRASAARVYWETARALGLALAGGQAPAEVSLPVGFTVFPGEVYPAPRSWAERVYPNLTYFNEVDKGGHFAAWEEPELFADELRAAFRSLRQ